MKAKNTGVLKLKYQVGQMDDFGISGSLHFILSNKEGKNFMTSISEQYY